MQGEAEQGAFPVQHVAGVAGCAAVGGEAVFSESGGSHLYAFRHLLILGQLLLAGRSEVNGS